MKHLAALFDRNVAWARQTTEHDPEFFQRLSSLKAPELLWIGCADARIPANVIAGLAPGEVLVHRNVANLVLASDLNCMAVVQYAVEVLEVKDIVVCGHYGCNGIHTARCGAGDGLVDYWLEPVKQLALRHQERLAALPDEGARTDFLCEENVREQVANVAGSPALRRARECGREVGLHGWIYGLGDGMLHDLKCDCTAATE